MNDENFAIRLIRAQNRAGMSQAKLAKEAQVHHSSIRDFQSDICVPNMSTLVKIARTLDVSTDYLCGLKEDFK